MPARASAPSPPPPESPTVQLAFANQVALLDAVILRAIRDSGTT
jgi:hypothetical protein